MGKFVDVMKHSVLGLIDIYNLLPQAVVDKKDVHEFQRGLQELLREEAKLGIEKWQFLFSPRNEVWNNKLHRHISQCPSGPNAIEESATKTGDTNANTCIQGWLRFGQA